MTLPDPSGAGQSARQSTSREVDVELPIAPRILEQRLGRRWSGVLRLVLLVAILGAGAVVLADKHQELTGALHLLGHLRWGWVLVAAVAEALSLGPFARLQRRMFRAGGVNLGFWSTVWVTLAGNALGCRVRLSGTPADLH